MESTESTSARQGHDAVEDGLVQQKEVQKQLDSSLKLCLQMEKELDETFSERRLLVEAEARADSWLGSHT